MVNTGMMDGWVDGWMDEKLDDNRELREPDDECFPRIQNIRKAILSNDKLFRLR
jgi:hypothetical protein